MTIKEAAEITGISIDNLRYYERIGLIPPVPRTSSGIRNYNEMTLHWIEFAMRCKNAGVPLEAIIEYMKLAFEGEHTKAARRDILIETKENMLEQIEKMKNFLNIIEFKLENYYNMCLPQTDQIVRNWNAQNIEE